MISEDLKLLSIKIVSLELEHEHYGSHLKIMGRVILLVALQVVRSKYRHVAILHHSTIQPNSISITIYSEATTSRRQC